MATPLHNEIFGSTDNSQQQNPNNDGWFQAETSHPNQPFQGGGYNAPSGPSMMQPPNSFQAPAPQAQNQPSMFNLGGMMQSMAGNSTSPEVTPSLDKSGIFDDEPPLLEELGVNFPHIWTKTSAVMVPMKQIDSHILDDTDLAGPLLFCLIQGFCLMFSGKLHFGYLFGFGAVGCIFITTVFSLMHPTRNANAQQQNLVSVDIYRVFSVLGYCLLPIVLLSALTILVSLKGTVGLFLSILSILWCTFSATRLFVMGFSMQDQRFLIAYPVFLLYACFALITIF